MNEPSDPIERGASPEDPGAADLVASDALEQWLGASGPVPPDEARPPGDPIPPTGRAAAMLRVREALRDTSDAATGEELDSMLDEALVHLGPVHRESATIEATRGIRPQWIAAVAAALVVVVAAGALVLGGGGIGGGGMTESADDSGDAAMVAGEPGAGRSGVAESDAAESDTVESDTAESDLEQTAPPAGATGDSDQERYGAPATSTTTPRTTAPGSAEPGGAGAHAGSDGTVSVFAGVRAEGRVRIGP